MFEENEEKCTNIHKNGAGTIAGTTQRTDLRREKLTDLFRKKEPVVPKIPGMEEQRRTHSISDPEYESVQVD